MIRRIANYSVPLYIAILLLVIINGAIAVLFALYFYAPVYSYQVYVPQAGGTAEKLEFGSWPALANASFFNQVRGKLIDDKVSFIEADLSLMRLRVYGAGLLVKEVPILTKGRPGSWWETPAGLYKIEAKIKNHLSGFAGVYLPWSLPFQGNFFIHGWPYYPDGLPVGSKYSGGCIRLATEDAKAVYDLVRVGTPVLVYTDSFSSDQFKYQINNPKISAKSFLVADLKSNSVLARSSTTLQLPVASLTKLMTALVAVEYVNIEREIIIDERMLVPTSYPRLRSGQKISLFNLLKPLLMESSNEAAEAIAGFTGRERLIDLINKKSKAIGMTNTVFTDPSGRDSGNVSTAEDFFTLAKYIYVNRSFIWKISAGRAAGEEIYGPAVFKNLKNFNAFYNDPDFVGGKVGMSRIAGETLVSVFNVGQGDGGRPIAVIILGSEDYTADGRKLISWVKENYF